MKAGGSHSPETRAKIAASLRGRPRSAETRARMRAAKLGRTYPPEHRAAISAGLTRPERTPPPPAKPPQAPAGERETPALAPAPAEPRATVAAAWRDRKPFLLADLSKTHRRILFALRGAGPGRPCSVGEIADLVYVEREDGGPDDAAVVIRVTVQQLRARLAGTCVVIHSRPGPGGGYWLGGPAAGELSPPSRSRRRP